MGNKLEKAIEWCIFQSRWLQVPVYFGMCMVMGMYSYVFCKEVIHTLLHLDTFTEEAIYAIHRNCGCINGFKLNHRVCNRWLLVFCEPFGNYRTR